jgi:DNA-binding GntR family transcriptional regulator
MLDSVPFDIERQSLADRVYDHIKHLILSGQLPAGTRVPEKAIAEKFSLSRTPVREALRRLEDYGLVLIKPRSYAEVVGLAPEQAPAIAEMRHGLESLAISLLAQRGRQEDFDELRKLAAQCSEALESGDIARTFELDSEFHLEIARRTGNPYLYEFSERFDAKIQLLRLVLHFPKERLQHFIGHHTPLLDAAEKGDVEMVADLMRHHIMDQLAVAQE